MEATYTLDRTGSVSEGLPLMEIEEGDDSTFLTEAPATSQVVKLLVDCLLHSGLKYPKLDTRISFFVLRLAHTTPPGF